MRSRIPPDLAVSQRLGEDYESVDVLGLGWCDAAQGQAVLELILVVRRRDNRPIDAEDSEAVLVVAAGVLDKDNPAETEGLLGGLGASLLVGAEVAGGIDERIERRGRYTRVAGRKTPARPARGRSA